MMMMMRGVRVMFTLLTGLLTFYWGILAGRTGFLAGSSFCVYSWWLHTTSKPSLPLAPLRSPSFGQLVDRRVP